jgi:hypothetical protein
MLTAPTKWLRVLQNGCASSKMVARPPKWLRVLHNGCASSKRVTHCPVPSGGCTHPTQLFSNQVKRWSPPLPAERLSSQPYSNQSSTREAYPGQTNPTVVPARAPTVGRLAASGDIIELVSLAASFHWRLNRLWEFLPNTCLWLVLATMNGRLLDIEWAGPRGKVPPPSSRGRKHDIKMVRTSSCRQLILPSANHYTPQSRIWICMFTSLLSCLVIPP